MGLALATAFGKEPAPSGDVDVLILFLQPAADIPHLMFCRKGVERHSELWV